VGLLPHPVAQNAPAAEQADAVVDLHDDRFIDGGNAGCELQRPGCQSLKRVSGRRLAVGAG